MKEDYVSFEIAKLLKEKGFDSEEVGCRDGFYSETTYESGHGIMTESGKEVGLIYEDLLNSELNHDEYLRPTLQMAMKWLREKYKILIVISGCVCDIDNYFVLIYTHYTNKLESCWQSHYTSDEYVTKKFPIYEEAVEAAIKYCLTNLI